MMIQISADPFSGQPVISVCSDYCTIVTGEADPSAQSPIRSTLPPAAPVRRRSGSLLGIGVVAVAAILVSAGFSSYRSSNAASQASAEASHTPPGSLAARQAPPERQGQRVEEALAGRPIVTLPPSTPAKGAGNPFGLE